MNEAEESIYLSRVLRAGQITKLLVKTRQQEAGLIAGLQNALSSHGLSTRVMMAGSGAEGFALNYENDSSKGSSDLDIISINEGLISHEKLRDSECSLSNGQLGHMIKVIDNEYPGYCELEVITAVDEVLQFCRSIDGISYLSNNLILQTSLKSFETISISSSVHGPALTADLNQSTVNKILSNRTEPLSLNIDYLHFGKDHRKGADDTDIVICLHSKHWPQEATKWIDRCRKSNWPTKAMVEKITKTGCILAPVGFKENPQKDIQWRISFNEAEQLMVEDFNETQIHCYFLLKSLKKEQLGDISGKNITSYILKSVLLWCMEEIDQEKWIPENLLKCFSRCIAMLAKWVSQRFMPNYFIVERNMFLLSELTEDIAIAVADRLNQILESPMKFIKNLRVVGQNFGKPLEELDVLTRFVEVYFWIEARIAMADQIRTVGTSALWTAYDASDVTKSITQCEVVLDTLKQLTGYFRPLETLVYNCLGVLHIVRSTEVEHNKEIHITKAEEYFKAVFYDQTHTPLRIATCYLMQKKYDVCKVYLSYVVDNDNLQFLIKFRDALNIVLEDVQLNIEDAFKDGNRQKDFEELLKIVQKDTDEQSIVDTGESLLSPDRFGVGGLYSLAFKQICFDVTFMPIEMKVLPRPLQLEVAVKGADMHATFHPLIYANFLRFLCRLHEEPNDHEGLVDVMSCLSHLISDIPQKFRSTGHNLLGYCYIVLRQDAMAASHLFKSLKLDPSVRNVSYWYLKRILNYFQNDVDDTHSKAAE